MSVRVGRQRLCKGWDDIYQEGWGDVVQGCRSFSVTGQEGFEYELEW